MTDVDNLIRTLRGDFQPGDMVNIVSVPFARYEYYSVGECGEIRFLEDYGGVKFAFVHRFSRHHSSYLPDNVYVRVQDLIYYYGDNDV